MKLISPSLEYSDAFMVFLWVHSPIYRSITTNHQKLNTASGRYYLVFFPIHIAAHIYGLIHYVIISLFGHLPVNHIQHIFFEQYRTMYMKNKTNLWKSLFTSGFKSLPVQFIHSIWGSRIAPTTHIILKGTVTCTWRGHLRWSCKKYLEKLRFTSESRNNQ